MIYFGGNSMFNDERISLQIGKIYKKANFIVILIASIFFIARAMFYLLETGSLPISLFSTEIVSILVAVIILLFGEINYYNKEKDEMIIYKKYSFYSQAGKFLLIAIIFGYALSMINSFRRIGFDFPPNTIIFVYQIIGLIYFYFQFKKNNININYSFINNDNKNYYLNILKRILYLAITILIIYFVCGFISVISYSNISYLITFVVAAIYSIIGLGFEYLFLSFLEKLKYDNQSNCLKISYLISGIILILLFLCLSFVNLAISYISYEGGIFNLGSVISILNNSSTNIEYLIYCFIGLIISFIVSYSYKNKLTTSSIRAYLLFIIITLLWNLTNSVIVIYISNNNFIIDYLNITNIIKIVLNIVNILLFTLILYALIKEKGFSKKLYIIPITEIIIYVITIFLNTQNNLKILASFLSGFCLTIGWLIFIIITYKNSKKLQKNSEEYLS